MSARQVSAQRRQRVTRRVLQATGRTSIGLVGSGAGVLRCCSRRGRYGRGSGRAERSRARHSRRQRDLHCVARQLIVSQQPTHSAQPPSRLRISRQPPPQEPRRTRRLSTAAAGLRGAPTRRAEDRRASQTDVGTRPTLSTGAFGIGPAVRSNC